MEDTNLENSIAKLDLNLINSDKEIGFVDEEEKGKTERKTSSNEHDNENGKEDETDGKGKSTSCKKSNSFQFVKNIISGKGPSLDERPERLSQSKRDQILKDVKVDSLPQRFLAKYVGYRPCEGLWGIKNTRQPVDSMVEHLRKLEGGEDLPLLNVKVTEEGINVRIHQHSKSKMAVADIGLIPLQFISYAVQDTRYSKIFAFILVREMSSRKRTTECHAYLCDGIVSARKMALATALAFRQLEKSMKGKTHKFQVDLRSSDELENELTNNTPGGAAIRECDA